jgi:hypothetical protein
MTTDPVVVRGVLGWGNRKGGYEAYGPGGRWEGEGHYGHYGDLLGDALERAGATEGATLLVVAVPRFGDTAVLDELEVVLAARARVADLDAEIEDAWKPEVRRLETEVDHLKRVAKARKHRVQNANRKARTEQQNAATVAEERDALRRVVRHLWHGDRPDGDLWISDKGAFGTNEIIDEVTPADADAIRRALGEDTDDG